ncbi:hypothetical protein PENSPDRAFT_747662 [Peniophora sp. CONT]|nr:hypothetical protein PENSPDRAFT_747662 [Peniophora sp. CONT]
MLLQVPTPTLSYDSDEGCGTPSSSISDFSLADYPQAQAPTKSPPLVLGFDDALSTLSTAFCDDVRREDVPEPPPKKCHPVYYFEDGSLELLAEDTHYNVHRSMIRRHAPSWLTTLDRSPDVKTLADVSCEELDALLAILYPESCAQWGLASLQEWTAVLRLATLWSFATTRTLAIRELEPLASVIDKLVLARAHGVEQWLRPAFVELCLRPAKLTRAEAARLQARPDDVVLVFTIREEIKDSRLPREEVIVAERVDAWLMGRVFVFPVPDIASQTLPKAPTTSSVSSDARKARADEPSSVPGNTLSKVPSSSTESVAAPSERLDDSIQETAEHFDALPVTTTHPPSDTVVPTALPKDSPLIAATRIACSSTKPERFNTAVTLITASNANEFTAFLVDRLTETNPKNSNSKKKGGKTFQTSQDPRQYLHRHCTRSLLHRTARMPGFVPICATVLSEIAEKLPEGVRDVASPFASIASMAPNNDYTGPRLGRSRTRSYLRPALLAWRRFLVDGVQRKDVAEILNHGTVDDTTYTQRGERLDSLGKALIANGLLKENDLDEDETV